MQSFRGAVRLVLLGAAVVWAGQGSVCTGADDAGHNHGRPGHAGHDHAGHDHAGHSHAGHNHGHSHRGHEHGHPAGTRAGAARAGDTTAERPISTYSIVLLIVYSLLIMSASLGGGLLPSLIHLTHRRMQLIVSLVAGLMLGIALFHLLPHALVELGGSSPDRVMHWMMGGLLLMFFLNRAFHFHVHQHDVPEVAGAEQPPAGPELAHDHDHDHSHDHDHDHDHDHGHAGEVPAEHAAGPAAPSIHDAGGGPQTAAGGVPPLAAGGGHRHGGSKHKFSWAGVAFGLSVHTLIDGMALAASVKADAAHGAFLSLFGLGTFLAIVLHKPLDAMPITSLMAAGGWSPVWRHCVNVGFSLMCPLGAGLFLLGMAQFSDYQHLLIGSALAFSAGVFLCISLGDLLPEIEFHSHDRLKLSFALLLGIALAWGIGFLEPEHAHHHNEQEEVTQPDKRRMIAHPQPASGPRKLADNDVENDQKQDEENQGAGMG